MIERPFRQLYQEIFSVNDWWNLWLSYMRFWTSFKLKNMKLSGLTQSVVTFTQGEIGNRYSLTAVLAWALTRMSTDQKHFVIAGPHAAVNIILHYYSRRQSQNQRSPTSNTKPLSTPCHPHLKPSSESKVLEEQQTQHILEWRQSPNSHDV